jgi:hypothetical protein
MTMALTAGFLFCHSMSDGLLPSKCRILEPDGCSAHDRWRAPPASITGRLQRLTWRAALHPTSAVRNARVVNSPVGCCSSSALGGVLSGLFWRAAS